MKKKLILLLLSACLVSAGAFANAAYEFSGSMRPVGEKDLASGKASMIPFVVFEKSAVKGSIDGLPGKWFRYPVYAFPVTADAKPQAYLVCSDKLNFGFKLGKGQDRTLSMDGFDTLKAEIDGVSAYLIVNEDSGYLGDSSYVSVFKKTHKAAPDSAKKEAAKPDVSSHWNDDPFGQF
jgi:hypothetical protein